MAVAARPVSTSAASTLVLVAVAIAALYFGQKLLIPFALAFLLSFLLAPLVHRLERWVGRVSAVVVVLLVLLCSFGFFGWIVSSQLFDLARKLPEYKDNIQKKILMLQPARGGALSKLSEAIEQIQQELDKEPVAPVSDSVEPRMPLSVAAKDSFVIPVRVVEPEHTAVNFLRGLLGPLVGPLGTAGLVLLYVVFMLVQRESLRDRLIRLIGLDRIGATTQGLDDAASRVSRFLVMQLAVNATFGICVATGLYFIGVPNALLWGLMVTVLRFIPYVGFWIAASMPIALSFAVFDTWGGPLVTIGLYIGLDLAIGNVIEPLLFGARAGVSPLAIIMAAVFWTWLWGPAGLILATPLTVCLAVLGRHVPQLEFLGVLLGDKSALLPYALSYQRLLALDQEEATEVAERYLKKHSLPQLYDEVLVPALAMAERDYLRGTIDEAKQGFILQSLREMTEELADYSGDAAPEPLVEPPPAPFVCLPAKEQADEIAGAMLVQMAQKAGLRAHMVPAENMAFEMVGLVEQHAAGTVCVSVLRPLSISHARYLCKRLRQRFPDLKIVVGLWNAEELLSKAKERLLAAGASEVVTKLSHALAQVR
jgi:predicted PurR-regulated permease PerM